MTAIPLDLDRYDDFDPDGDGDAVDAGELEELDRRLARVSSCVLAMDPDPLFRMDPTASIPQHLRHAGRRH